MGEGVKAGLAVVGPHAALPEAAEAHLRGGQVDDRVVHAAAAEAAAGEHSVRRPPIGGEHVERQGVGQGIHFADDLVQAVIGQHRQNRPEDFLPHHRV